MPMFWRLRKDSGLLSTSIDRRRKCHDDNQELKFSIINNAHLASIPVDTTHAVLEREMLQLQRLIWELPFRMLPTSARCIVGCWF